MAIDLNKWKGALSALLTLLEIWSATRPKPPASTFAKLDEPEATAARAEPARAGRRATDA